jgi:hypothetical protein
LGCHEPNLKNKTQTKTKQFQNEGELIKRAQNPNNNLI